MLYAKDADSPRPVASTQKLITALCVLDAGNIDKPVTITADDIAEIDARSANLTVTGARGSGHENYG